MAQAKVLDISTEDYEYLQSLTRQRTIQAQVVDRAKIFKERIEVVMREETSSSGRCFFSHCYFDFSGLNKVASGRPLCMEF